MQKVSGGISLSLFCIFTSWSFLLPFATRKRESEKARKRESEKGRIGFSYFYCLEFATCSIRSETKDCVKIYFWQINSFSSFGRPPFLLYSKIMKGGSSSRVSRIWNRKLMKTILIPESPPIWAMLKKTTHHAKLYLCTTMT